MNDEEKIKLTIKVLDYVIEGGGSYRELLYNVLEIKDYFLGCEMGLLEKNNELFDFLEKEGLC
jgi:hypothetical protein